MWPAWVWNLSSPLCCTQGRREFLVLAQHTTAPSRSGFEPAITRSQFQYCNYYYSICTCVRINYVWGPTPSCMNCSFFGVSLSPPSHLLTLLLQRSFIELINLLKPAPYAGFPLATLAAVPDTRHVNHVGLTPLVLTELTEALNYCATQTEVWPFPELEPLAVLTPPCCTLTSST